MKLKTYLIIAFSLSVVSIIGFSLISLLISDQKIIHFDRTIIDAVQGMETPFLTSVMKFFTFIGSAPFVIVLSLFLLLFLYKVLHHRLELILFVAAIVGSAILNGILKNFFQRVRPEFHRLIEIEGYSFPSGHAMNAFTVYGIITFLLWRHITSSLGRWALIFVSMVMIIAIGISRIYLGVHYPSDIIGGYFASAFWITTAIIFFQYYQVQRYNKRQRREKNIA
ncbi:phosphatase PAP2 family protein [Neobacillus sp. MER 74]|uniref:phosphatase PAP2 family protein n=1 Tax=Neobacillus sp. MER 74 TaxID=2939566 RepID=UPI002040107C|nr:phosphatase PAP2 family protein [Neobacillus sp. MER 74]MCM3116853.1 phosphatase PAP2 family protein [Neobacillus sp. MER 74]